MNGRVPSLSDWLALYHKYDSELQQLARCMRDVYHTMQRRMYGTTFGDVEGECMYILIRESLPDIVFEISPNAGWSTNYILAALTANGHGGLHSFEIATHIRGKPIEAVIRGNQHPSWDQARLSLHIGDARETVSCVDSTINFLLIDSCHEDWFADWYIKSVFPRVRGLVMVQDIAFIDGLEPSSEARYFWNWLEQERICSPLIGQVEAELENKGLRLGYAERRALRCNSVLLSFPNLSYGILPRLTKSPDELLKQAEICVETGALEEAERLLSEVVYQILRSQKRVNRHRLLYEAGRVYLRIGDRHEADRVFQRSLGVVVQSDMQQRIKGLAELLHMFLVCGRFRLAIQSGFLLLISRRDGPWQLIQVAVRLGSVALRHALRRKV